MGDQPILLRTLDLRKSPSISETLDWAKSLVALNAKQLDRTTLDMQDAYF